MALLTSVRRRRGDRLVAAVTAALADRGVSSTLLPARDRAEAEARAGEAVAGGAAAVAALGGDGCAHAALQAVAGTPAALAVLPAGSGNDLAAALGVPADPVAAARAAAGDLLDGRHRTMDAGRTGDRWWATVLCCGFDSAVTERAHRLHRPRGPRRYDLALLAELARLRPRAVTLTVDGASRELAVTLVAVANTSRYGGGLRIAPAADPGDGLLDVVVVGPVGRRELVRTRPRVVAGTHVDHPAVTVLRGREVALCGAGLGTYADGEPVAPLPAVSVCVPGALTVVGTAG